MSDTQQQQTQPEQTSQKADTKSTKTTAKGKTTSKTTTTTSKSMPKKAEAVLAAEEIGRMVDLGLGRGIDATSPSPWQMKSSFQVRNCTSSNTIGTEEGGALQSYEREVSSVHTQQTNLKASVAFPQAPVNIGIDAEQSRSFSSTRKAVGKKVINRTISFRADFHDLPQTRTDDPNKAKLASAENLREAVYSEEQERSSADSQNDLTFEERLSRWIIERILQRESLKKLQLEDEGKPAPPSKLHLKGESPVSDLASFLQSSSKDERREIVTDCSDFVHHFRITHYVNAIELGAAQYRVLSETEYYDRVGITGKLGIEALANFVLSETVSRKRTQKASDVRQIGVIGSDGRVHRGSYDEAVVGIQIQPIHSLLRLRYLQLAMRKALLEYIKVQGDTSVGPYVVACDDDKIFWSVNKDDNYAIEATRKVENASLFYVIPNDDGAHPYEFIIGYYGDAPSQPATALSAVSSPGKTEVEPVARYLNAPVNIVGENLGPLHLQYEVQEKHSRLTLLSRLVKGYSPVDTKAWVSGRDLFFINCARRTWKKDGYICVKQITGRGQQPRLTTACVSSVKRNNERDLWMLFRLLPASHRNKVPTGGEVDGREEEVREEDEEFEIAFGSETPEEKPRSRLAVPKPGRSHPHHPRTEGRIGGRRDLDTSGGTIPPPGGGVDLPELSHPPTSDPTRVRIATTTPL